MREKETDPTSLSWHHSLHDSRYTRRGEADIRECVSFLFVREDVSGRTCSVAEAGLFVSEHHTCGEQETCGFAYVYEVDYVQKSTSEQSCSCRDLRPLYPYTFLVLACCPACTCTCIG